MSGESRPISAEQFALAILDLPVENLYSKANEIQNSISHLRQSNAQLQEYSDSIKSDLSLDVTIRSQGDADCLDAIKENDMVIQRQIERISLLKREVERRGGRWHEEEAPASSTINGEVRGSAGAVADSASGQADPSNPRYLSDEEVRRRLDEQLGPEEEEEEEDDDGMHL